MQGIFVTLPELLALRSIAFAQSRLSYRKVRMHYGSCNKTAVKGRGMDFEETRLYQPGDDIRRMDWRVMAKTGKPHTKVYREEQEHSVFIVTDFSHHMYFGTKVAFKSNIAAKIAAMFVWYAYFQQASIGGGLFSENEHVFLKSQNGNQGVLPYLQSLCAFSQREHTSSGDDAFLKVLLQLKHLVRPGSMLVFIGDFQTLDEIHSVHLWQLAQRNQLYGICIYDRLERQLPPAGLYAVSNGEAFYRLDTHEKWCHQQYRLMTDEKQTRIKTIFSQCAASFIEISTEEDWQKKFFSLFGRDNISHE